MEQSPPPSPPASPLCQAKRVLKRKRCKDDDDDDSSGDEYDATNTPHRSEQQWLNSSSDDEGQGVEGMGRDHDGKPSSKRRRYMLDIDVVHAEEGVDRHSDSDLSADDEETAEDRRMINDKKKSRKKNRANNDAVDEAELAARKSKIQAELAKCNLLESVALPMVPPIVDSTDDDDDEDVATTTTTSSSPQVKPTSPLPEQRRRNRSSLNVKKILLRPRDSDSDSDSDSDDNNDSLCASDSELLAAEILSVDTHGGGSNPMTDNDPFLNGMKIAERPMAKPRLLSISASTPNGTKSVGKRATGRSRGRSRGRGRGRGRGSSRSRTSAAKKSKSTGNKVPVTFQTQRTPKVRSDPQLKKAIYGNGCTLLVPCTYNDTRFTPNNIDAFKYSVPIPSKCMRIGQGVTDPEAQGLPRRFGSTIDKACLDDGEQQSPIRFAALVHKQFLHNLSPENSLEMEVRREPSTITVPLEEATATIQYLQHNAKSHCSEEEAQGFEHRLAYAAQEVQTAAQQHQTTVTFTIFRTYVTIAKIKDCDSILIVYLRDSMDCDVLKCESEFTFAFEMDKNTPSEYFDDTATVLMFVIQQGTDRHGCSKNVVRFEAIGEDTRSLVERCKILNHSLLNPTSYDGRRVVVNTYEIPVSNSSATEETFAHAARDPNAGYRDIYVHVSGVALQSLLNNLRKTDARADLYPNALVMSMIKECRAEKVYGLRDAPGGGFSSNDPDGNPESDILGSLRQFVTIPIGADVVTKTLYTATEPLEIDDASCLGSGVMIAAESDNRGKSKKNGAKAANTCIILFRCTKDKQPQIAIVVTYFICNSCHVQSTMTSAECAFDDFDFEAAVA
jgi:hypothetical protein